MQCNIYIYIYLNIYIYICIICVQYTIIYIYICMYVCMWVYTLWAGGNELIPVAAVFFSGLESQDYDGSLQRSNSALASLRCCRGFQTIWANYSDLTVTSLESWLDSKGNYPTIAYYSLISS